MTETRPKFTIQRLAWRDRSLSVITLANGRRMRLTLGLGSGLSQRPGDPKGTVWTIADRGPNLKIKPAIKRYGLEHLRPLAKVDGAKIMPRPDIGPTICQLRLHGNKVKLIRRIPLRGVSGRAISGLPIPAGAADVEPAFDLKGAAHPGVAAFKSGRHVRIWKLDVLTGAVAAQFLYPLDEPATFQQDQKAGEVDLTDIKVSEATAVGPDRLLILERISRTTKIYRVFGPALHRPGGAHQGPDPSDT